MSQRQLLVPQKYCCLEQCFCCSSTRRKMRLRRLCALFRCLPERYPAVPFPRGNEPIHDMLVTCGRQLRSVSTDAAASQGADNDNCEIVLLVESPAKARKIQEYLGSRYRVLASYGHIRDLPAKPGSVVPEESFAMRWELNHGAEPHIKDILSAVASTKRVILATDPDREGEAIAWHLVEELRACGVLQSNDTPQRVSFTEVTRPAVLAALRAPRQISQPLVDAYMARRALDYLFGFHLSPMLWRKLPSARSAGRVQSVALRLVTEREAAIETFVPQKYWTVHACIELPNDVGAVAASLISVDGTPPPEPGFLHGTIAQEVAARIAASRFTVSSMSRKETTRNPFPPYTTSTLQQDANSRLGYGAARTMQLAQQLYEAGLITYMRTDGVTVAPDAVSALRAAVKGEFGAAYLPDSPRHYASRAKNSQEAHEAIRPTDASREASSLDDQDPSARKLYALVRARALASQMAGSRTALLAAELTNEDGTITLRSTAHHTLFPGYTAAYAALSSSKSSATKGELDEVDAWDEESAAHSGAPYQRRILIGEIAAAALVSLSRGDQVELLDSAAVPHETRPPGRFTEGTLVKALEEVGVGRPSTYAPILKLLQTRRYIRKQGRVLHAEPLGRILSAFLTSYFAQWVDYGFTSRMETELDEVSAGEARWKDVLERFWGPFTQAIDEMGAVSGRQVIDVLNTELATMLWGARGEDKRQLSGEESKSCSKLNAAIDGEAVVEGRHTYDENRNCPSCGSPLSLKLSHRAGPFVGCSSYPQCSYTRPVIPVAPFESGDEEELSQDGNDEGAPSNEEPNSAKLRAVQHAKDFAAKHDMKNVLSVLGTHVDGREIFVRTGPYGPYVQLGLDIDDGMRRFPLRKPFNVRNITLEYAQSLLSLPRDLGLHPATDRAVFVRNGKFGPYVLHGNLRRSIPCGIDPLTITMEDALTLLAEAAEQPEGSKKRRIKPAEVNKTKGSDRSAHKSRKTGATDTVKVDADHVGADPVLSSSATDSLPLLRRPRNPYNIFASEMSRKVAKEAEENSDALMAGAMPQGYFLRRVAELWRALPDEEREVFYQEAKREKEMFAAQAKALKAYHSGAT